MMFDYGKRSIGLQILMNVIPLLGVIFYNWSVFALIYSYWLESLGLAFISSIKILFSVNTGGLIFRIKSSIKYFVVSTFFLLFYLLFIVIFLGLLMAQKQEGVMFLKYLLLMEPTFRYTVLAFLGIKLLELFFDFFLTNAYQTTEIPEQSAIFNPRTIFMHLVIILGFLSYQYLSEKFNDRIGIIAFAAVFVIIKSLVDIVLAKRVIPQTNVTDKGIYL